MSTSLLYHAFGLSDYAYVHQKFANGGIIFRVRPKWRLIRCPVCRARNVIRRGFCVRRLRTTPIGFKPVWLDVELPRVYCPECGCVRQINPVIARQRKSYTRAFEKYVVMLAKVMTLADIAKILGISWDCVKDIVKSRLLRRFSKVSFKGVRDLGIDEISVRKGHKYLTVVMDLERGNVIYVGDGKGADALNGFWKRLGKYAKNIMAVSTDLSAAYISAVLEHLPGVPLVFDHFHLVKLANDTLTETRRGLYHELKDKMGKDVVKGMHWILLKNHENLSEEKGEASRLQEALELNEPLALAYYMKEDMRQFWQQSGREEAEKLINSWLARAWSSGITNLIKLANTIAIHKFGILNWYDHPVSSGKVEGTNNKIKVLKRMAYGYRDMEFFKLRILAIHEAKYALAG
ncbi:MAG: ISL3 family transposase [Desulfovibrio sp.]|nr:ISL3 family transposase [Desulfovibrio sp.]